AQLVEDAFGQIAVDRQGNRHPMSRSATAGASRAARHPPTMPASNPPITANSTPRSSVDACSGALNVTFVDVTVAAVACPKSPDSDDALPSPGAPPVVR